MKPNTSLQVGPIEYVKSNFRGINAPAEFTIEYDKDGKPIFNKYDFVEYLAEMMATMIHKQVEERVGSIESATTVVPPNRVETIETLPVATEVIPLNDNEAIV